MYRLLLIILGFSASVRADLQPQDLRLWRRASTVVSGQQVWSFQSSYQNISSHYGAGGVSQPLGQGLTRQVRWKQLLAADPGVQSYMRANHLSEDDVAATAAYDVTREEIGFGLNWAYGLTRSWMVGFEVPTILRSTKVSQDVNVAGTAPPGGPQNFTARVQNLAAKQLAQAGFAPVPPQRQTFSLGDVSLLSREALADTYSWVWSLQQIVRVPTAQNPNLSDYIADSRSEGPVNVGLSSLLDYRIRRFIVGGRAGYTYQLPDQVRMRVADGTVDPKVSRQLGSYFYLATDAEYRATEHFSVTLGYSYLNKSSDSYAQGPESGFDYRQLGDDTDQILHQSRLGVFYALDEHHDGALGASERWLVGLDYIYPWIGRNAVDAARASVELTNYF